MRIITIGFSTLAIAALLSGCTSLVDKAVGIASAVDAVKVETSGSLASGTILPNITLGGAVNAIATSPAVESGKTAAPVYPRSRRNSFFGDLFGVDNSTEAISYIGVPGETADDTVKRVNALSGVKTAAGSNTDTKTVSD